MSPQIGGVNITWDENKPAGTDSVSIGDDQIRSDKTALRTALAAEHVFSASGGANTGAHVLGSARPFYDVQSNVSSTGSDGRIMLTSDTSRLFAVGSGGTVFLGGATVLSMGSYPGTVPQRSYWALEAGAAVTGASGGVLVSFPNSGFSTTPTVVACPSNQSFARTVGVGNVTTTSFQAGLYNDSGATVAGGGFNWFAIGMRVL